MKQEITEGIKIFLISLSVTAGIMLLCSFLFGCTSVPPKMDIIFWAGDSSKDGITRAQESRTIECDEAEIDDYACLTYEDVKKMFDTMNRCQDWGGE